MSIDEAINKVLPLFEDKEQHKVTKLVFEVLGVIDINFTSKVREKMIRKRLIEEHTLNGGDIITDHGMNILENGGWLVSIGLAETKDKLAYEQLRLDVDNLKAQKPRYWLTTLLASIAVGITGYSIFLDGKISDIKEQLKLQQQKIDSLSNVQDAHRDHLKMMDTKIQAIENHVQELTPTGRPSKPFE